MSFCNLVGTFGYNVAKLANRSGQRGLVVFSPAARTSGICRHSRSRLLLSSGLLLRRTIFYSRFTHGSEISNLRRLRIIGLPTVVLHRNVGSLGRIARSLLRLRYLVLGGAVGGGVTLSQKIESWKESVPDFSWIGPYLPDSTSVDWLTGKWVAGRDNLAEKVQGVNESLGGVKEWFKLVSKGSGHDLNGDGLLYVHGTGSVDPEDRSYLDALKSRLDDILSSGESQSSSSGASDGGLTGEKSRKDERINTLQDEIIQIQAKYQRELERLEKENKELRRQAMLRGDKSGRRRRKVKKSLIDMYSEVLDSLIGYDSSYSTQDHLPRVVVVGDQSSGKTSVLEMIAQARIFPRGSGEMMTRAPVKVTLSEGPYHVAEFRDSQREFDLTKESELAELRREIEIRMKNSVADGKTVSNEVISLTVKGPGIPRMVLVDLPGVISTVTTEMARETKDDIVKICRTYMENPNAIILCIQDGSVDAERSNVTDLVSAMDPSGKRTILVLTKVDLAEESLTNPDRIKKILEGKLFPMKALGYFAVVTGRGNTGDNIETIRRYEENFFRKSKLFREGVLKSTQMTTQNMSLAVSGVFWKMVKESIEQQADAFKATRFNLETEWKNNFPRQRELDRDELFEKARGEILDEIINLSQITPKQWEEVLQKKLYEKISNYMFENIYIPATLAANASEFNTLIDIKLKHWTDSLPKKSVEVGWETLKAEFNKLVEQDSKVKDHDPIFDPLKLAVLEHAMNSHIWERKAIDYLKVIQLNAMDDRSVPDKPSWDLSLKFMELAVRERLEATTKLINEMRGPGLKDQWLKWTSPTEVQSQRCAAMDALRKMLSREPEHKPMLASDELTMVRKAVKQDTGVDLETDVIREVWHQLYRLHFLEIASASSRNCRNFFYHYQKGFSENEVDCNAVVLFWRVQKMLQVTSNSLRQQITNSEARRLEKQIKELLDDWSQDPDIKKQYITGKRVKLAEELKQVRSIQERIEEFIQALNTEKP